MKSIYICLLLYSLIFIYCSDKRSCDDVDSGVSSGKDCQNYDLTESTSHCCFLKMSMKVLDVSADYARCWEVTQEQYEHIKTVIKTLENECNSNNIDCTVKKLECKSSYLSLSIFSLILLLL